ncbi:hypothetical protein ACFS32_04500 [Novosphingobium pokkalii]|uniref:hypothetical protein n=1 Tax=Novosphingobium pokkalii TaxID=1770194 RepID=UPI0036314584
MTLQTADAVKPPRPAGPLVVITHTPLGSFAMAARNSRAFSIFISVGAMRAAQFDTLVNN